MADDKTKPRFIPFQKSELVDLLCADGKLSAPDQARFREVCQVLQGLYHFRFHGKLEELKEAYFPFNPDRDTQTRRAFGPAELEACEKRLVGKLSEILNDANYEQVTQEEIESALNEESLFHIKLRVHFGDFASHVLFWRGQGTRKVAVRHKLFWKREIEVPVYERVVLLIKFKGEEYFKKKKRTALQFTPSSMVLKLFKNIPKADLEMLFPNIEVLMRLKDKLLLGVPGLAGGVGMLVKAGAAIVGGIGIIWLVILSYFYDENPKYPEPGEMAAVIAALIGLGSLVAYLWRQWGAYKNRKMSFMKALADNLYFRNLDNNAGVFFHIIDDAEEEECKEAMLAYYFLLTGPEEGATESALDDAVEAWFRGRHGVEINFEVDDAMRKLKDLELCAPSGAGADARWTVRPLEKACERLDHIWDNIFQYNQE